MGVSLSRPERAACSEVDTIDAPGGRTHFVCDLTGRLSEKVKKKEADSGGRPSQFLRRQ